MTGAAHLKCLHADQADFDRDYRPSLAGRFGEGILCRQSQDFEYLLLQNPRRRQTIVAAAKLLIAQGNMQLRYLEVAHDARKHGFGRALFAEVFAHAAARKHDLVVTPYTAYGRAYLWPLQDELAEAHYPHTQVRNLNGWS